MHRNGDAHVFTNRCIVLAVGHVEGYRKLDPGGHRTQAWGEKVSIQLF